jgi:glycerol-1-phosphate dehydrogenase [NAD(P)+]
MLLFDALGDDVRRAHGDRLEHLPRVWAIGDCAEGDLAHALAEETVGRRATLLFDVRTYGVGGARCAKALEGVGFSVAECLVADRHGASPTCDDRTREEIVAGMPASDALVAVGSGVINDLAKWLAWDAGIPYGVFATAASMNGYSSANVAATVKGVKSLVSGRAARVIAADPRVLAAAPHPLTTSGFGDLLAKPVSTADWIVNHELFDEPYSPTLLALVDRFESSVFATPEALAEGEEHAVRSLFEALVLSGCTMTLHGSSLPASGGEHVISHTLDMMSEADGTPHDLHGRQVGIGTVVSAALWERMMQVQAPRFDPVFPPFSPSLWGRAAHAVKEQLEAKRAVLTQACEALSRPGAWDRVRSAVSPHLRSPKLLRQRLRAAHGAFKLDQIGCTRERFLTAIHHAPAMRARFTSLDLAHVMGILPEETEAIVDAWAL